MYRLLFGLMLFLSFNINAQTTVFSEGFETLPLNVTSSGTSQWSRSSFLQKTGLYCDTASLALPNDSAIMTTTSFSTLGNSYVFLEFDHICKAEYFDGGIVQVSTDNGITWTTLTSTEYLGYGQFVGAGNKFNSVTYPLDWSPVNNNAIPDNSWWRHEAFDIGALVANTSHVKIRFVLFDGNGSGSAGNYGWAIDDIRIKISNNELILPVVNILSPSPVDSAFGVGPFDVFAHITDQSGIDTAYVVYTVNSLTDTVGMVLQSGSLYKGEIPAYPIGTSIQYYVVAIDNTTNSNKTETSKNNFTNYPDYTYVTIGFDPNSDINSPIYNGTMVSTDTISNHVSLFTAAELQGRFGAINQIEWYKNSPNTYTGNARLEIYLAATTATAVPANSAALQSIISGATLVYSNQSQTLPAVNQPVAFNTTLNQFIYDGTSNLYVIVKWARSGSLLANNIQWNYSAAAGKAVTFIGSTSNPTTVVGSGQRPNIKIRFTDPIFNYDAGIKLIQSPQPTIVSSQSTPVAVRVRNGGISSLTKLNIHYEIDGVAHPVTAWTGSIATNFNSTDIVLGSHQFSLGAHKIKTWTSLPNDSVDQYNLNDTMRLDFYSCFAILNGTYFIGGSSADFATIEEALTGLKTCGVTGPVVFKINPGIYEVDFVIDQIAPGIDSVNTVTFTSATGNADDVILRRSTSNNQSQVITLDQVSYYIFSNLTVDATKNSTLRGFYLAGNSEFNIIENCKIFSNTGSSLQNYPVYIFQSGNNKLLNNYISGGYYAVHIQGNYNSKAENMEVIGNYVTNFERNGIYTYYQKNLKIHGNKVRKQFQQNGSTNIGIYVESTDVLEVTKNDIKLYPFAAAYGMYIASSNGLANAPGLVANNMVIVESSSSTSTAFRALYSSSSSNIDYINNTFVSSGGTSATETGYFEGNSSSIRVYNNVFANFSGNYAIEKTATSSIAAMNYNAYYTTGGQIINWGGTVVGKALGIAGIKAVTLMDTNSMIANPMIFSLNDGHSFSQALNGAAKPFSNVVIDFDGQPRSSTTPDIGADEFDVSTIDLSLTNIINPLAVDTQNRNASIGLVLVNTGTDTINSFNITYQLNQSSPVVYSFSGQLLPAQTDTIYPGIITVPALNNTLLVYSTLAGDTIHGYDTLQFSFYGMPLIDAELVAVIEPGSGCSKSNAELVKIKILNNGLVDINSGLMAHYQVNGGAAISESISTPIVKGQNFEYTFSATLNMLVGNTDSIFNIKAWVSHASDPYAINDSSFVAVTSMSFLPAPVVSDTSIGYATSVTLSASASNPIQWFSSSTSTQVLANDSVFTTPLLFDTTTYYAMVNTSVPELTGYVGLASTFFGFWDPAIYGGNGQGGRYQILYTAAELQAAGLASGLIKSLSFNVLSGGSTVGNMAISLATTNASVMSAAFISTNFTQVYNSPYTTVDGWNTHVFSAPFYWDGITNILVQVCTQGISTFAPQQLYTATTSPMYTAVSGFGASCTSASGSAIVNRPNIKFETLGTDGCVSQRVPVTVSVPKPSKDALFAAIVEPVSGCGIASTPVVVDIVNNGIDSLSSGFTVSYKVNNGSYITPEVVNQFIGPEDTLRYTFNTMATLPTGASGSNYQFTFKVNASGDAYAGNDSLVTDSILSDYTPTNPIVNNLTVAYGASASLSGISSDTIYWYSNPSVSQLIGIGNNFQTNPIFDTTLVYAQSRKTKIVADYLIGTGTPNIAGPSPYGSSLTSAKHQFLYRASELRAMGMMQGYINSLAFDGTNIIGTAMDNYTIKIGLTNEQDLDRKYFINNLTTVYSVQAYSEVFGWNVHQFSSPFYWDGKSNIVIETCFANQSSRNYTTVKGTNTSYKSTANVTGYNNFSCSNDTVIQSTYTQRPYIKFNQVGYGYCGSDIMPLTISVSSFPAIDAGIHEVILPQNVSAALPDSVSVIIRNFGLNNLTSAQIAWSDNGVLQTPVSWTGNLAHGEIDTVLLSSNHNFIGGISTLAAWTIVLNDGFSANDTAEANRNICMSGVYTVKSSGGSFNSIQNAINSLNICGVCGPVIISIDSGAYFGPFEISPIMGASASNDITFQSASMDSSSVSIFHTTIQSSNFVWQFNGASFINLKHLSLTANGSNYSNVVVLKNAAHHIKIENCILTSGIPTSGEASNIVAQNTPVSYITLKNNVLNNGLRSIHFYGSTTVSTSNLIIENNIVKNYTNFGTYLYYTSNVSVKGNEFTSSNNTQLYGVYSYYGQGNTISKNKISLIPISSAYGIYGSLTGTAAQRSVVDNNMISIIGGTQSVYGVYLSSSPYIDILFNSMYASNGNTSTRLLYLTSVTNCRILNNNLYTRSGYVFYTNSVSGITAMDYNNLHTDITSTTNYVFWGANIANLAALKIQDPALNQNSLNINPNFYSNSDLHAQEISLYNAGTPIPNFTTDIDGDLRSTSSPSIGADEFTPPAIDLGLIDIVYPSASDCNYSSTDSIVVELKNFGLNNLNFTSSPATITVEINGINPDTITYVLNSGLLNSGNAINIKVSNNYDLSANGQYSFRAFVSIPSDGLASNDVAPIKDIVSLPTINNFPFVLDFETGTNLTFKESIGNNSSLTLSGSAAASGQYGLHFQGGSTVGWTSGSNVNAAFSNTSHVTKAFTCNVDATGLPLLSMKFDLKQTAYSPTTIQTNSWFRVLISTSNGTYYLKNLNGDSVFRPLSANADPFVTQTFNLNSFAGQQFSVSLEAACYYAMGTGSYSGDNAFVDNFTIWSPANIDVGANGAVVGKRFGMVNSQKSIAISIENFGSDTLFQVPVAYQYANNPIHRDTAFVTLIPSQVDTFNFLVPISLLSGDALLKVFTELPTDVYRPNDTATVVLKGLLNMPLDYFDDFESTNYWYGTGTQNQWQLGVPNTQNLNSAYSGTKAWATRLTQNYLSNSSEYLYSSYFTIPQNSDTAIVRFYHKMRVVAAQAFGVLEYTVDNGQSWSSMGYISDPSTTNWYNTNINGQHAWSSINTNWVLSSIKLDPAVFNTGQVFQLRFTFISKTNAVTDEGWLIDDFSLSVPKAAKDAGITQILNPIANMLIGDAAAISVTIKNFGSDTLFSIPVRFTLGSVVYNELWTGTLLPDSTVNYTSNNQFFASNLGPVQFCASTLLVGDLKPSNNSTCVNFSVSAAAVDAAVLSLIAPSGHTTINGNISVRLLIANKGTTALNSIPVGYKVGSQIINEVYSGQINPGDSATYDFIATFNGPVGNYLLTAFTAVANDAYNANDTIQVNLLGTSFNDITADGFKMEQSIPNPAFGDVNIPFFMPNAGEILFSISTADGREISKETLHFASGQHYLRINSEKFNAGVYYYSMTYKGQRLTKRLIVL